MPESFDGMLAELADAAASATPLPDVAAVRRRARERTVHRRLAASALALTVLAACGGTVAAVAARQQPVSRGVGTLATAPATGRSADPAPTPSASTGTGAAAKEGAAGPYAAVAGRWQLLGGQSELIVYPDGVFGIGETGRWAFCDGRLKPLGDGTYFMVSVVACSDYGTVGLSLRVLAPGKELTLSAPGTSLTYRFVAPAAGAAITGASGTAVAVKELVGDWSSANKDARSFVLLADGYVSFQAYSGAGVDEPFAGKITGYYADAVRVEVPCGKQPAAGLDYCQVLQLEYDPKGLVTAVGGSGAEAFLPLAEGGYSFTGSAAAGYPTGAATGSATATAGP